MANKPEAPVDFLTDFPLPFVPNTSLPSVPRWGDRNYDRTVTNFHHSVFQRVEVESFGEGGKAARDSRIQWGATDDHNRYHDEWGGLDEHMPNTTVKQYRTALFGIMNYVPEHGISFDQPTPRVVELRGWQREMLRSSGQLMIGNDGARIRRFLLDYTFDNGAPQVDPRLIEQFLYWATRRNARPSKQLAIADVLMRQAIEPVVTPGLKEIYAYTKRNSMLRPHLPRALTSLIHREIVLGASGPQRFIDLLLDKCVDFKKGVTPAFG